MTLTGTGQHPVDSAGVFGPATGPASQGDVAPGQTFGFSVVTTQACATPSHKGYTSIDLAAPGGGTLTIAAAHFFPFCDDVRVQPYHLPWLDPQAAQPPNYPWQQLKAGLQLPAAVAPGASLDFTLALTNPGTDAVSLDPCPAYDMRLWDGSGKQIDRSYRLNCGGVPGGAVPAGTTVNFAMHTDVPADASLGTGGLVVFLGWEPDIFGPGDKQQLPVVSDPAAYSPPPAPTRPGQPPTAAPSAVAAVVGGAVTTATYPDWGVKLAYQCGAGVRQLDLQQAQLEFPTAFTPLGESVVVPDGTGKGLVACDFPPAGRAIPDACATTSMSDFSAPATAQCGGTYFRDVQPPGGTTWVLVQTKAGWTAYPVAGKLGIVRIASDLAAPQIHTVDDSGRQLS